MSSIRRLLLVACSFSLADSTAIELEGDVKKLLAAVQRVNAEHVALEDKLAGIEQKMRQKKDHQAVQDERIKLQAEQISHLKSENAKLLDRFSSIETVLAKVSNGARVDELESQNRAVNKRLKALESRNNEL
jgi:chromosome segregation ATPase